MAENSKKDILVMAMFMVTRDDVLACANELGISEEQVTDDVIELVKERVSEGLGSWRGLIKGMVKETISKGGIEKEVIECPLGLVCSPYCTWREVGECVSLRGVR